MYTASYPKLHQQALPTHTLVIHPSKFAWVPEQGYLNEETEGICFTSVAVVHERWDNHFIRHKSTTKFVQF